MEILVSIISRIIRTKNIITYFNMKVYKLITKYENEFIE